MIFILKTQYYLKLSMRVEFFLTSVKKFPRIVICTLLAGKTTWFCICKGTDMKLKPLSERKKEEGRHDTQVHPRSKKVRAGRNRKKFADPEKESTAEGRK
jgi:hypothetical protein